MIDLSRPWKWHGYLGGNPGDDKRDTIAFTLPEGKQPNAFHRLMQYLILWHLLEAGAAAMTNLTRDEHLAWCKRRALEYVDAGDLDQARTSMLSDLGKWEKPLYDQGTLGVLFMDALLFEKTPEQMRYWINGFK